MSVKTFIIHTNTPEQENAIKAFMYALKITFEVSKEKNYNPDFVEKIIESKKQISQGKFTDVKQKDLTVFIDGL